MGRANALDGRLALVTGASRGIGAAIAQALRVAGARVVRVARTLRSGERDGYYDRPADVSDPASVAALGARVLDELGPPDVVVNNAGTFALAPFEQTEVTDLQRQLAIGLIGPFTVARAFLPAMRAAGGGRLITIGSIADHVAFPENTAYSAAKYGLRGLHETLRAEYRGSGVHCTLISPGPTDTGIWDPIDPNHRAGLLPRTAMLRPDDVAEAVLFVATRPPHVDIDWLRMYPGSGPPDRSTSTA